MRFSGGMSMLPIVWLGVQGVLFAAWTVLAFRWLFAIRAQAVAESGSSVPGPGATLRAFRWGFVAPQLGRQRLWLAVLTLALLLASVSFGLVS